MDTEQATNDLIAVIWPLLDEGASKSDVQAIIHNVMDAWEPNPQEPNTMAADELAHHHTFDR